MRTETLRKNIWIDPVLQPPRVGHSVVYRTPTHLAFGFVDSTGRWLSFEGRVEPERVLAWHERTGAKN